jgi:hypothetical protein
LRSNSVSTFKLNTRMILSVNQCGEALDQRLNTVPGPLLVVWVQVTTSRTEFRDRLIEWRDGRPVVAVVIQDVLFSHSNAIMSDLRRVLEQNRHEFDMISDDIQRIGKAVLVILSRSELVIPQLSSPSTLPEWFPIASGRSIYVTIEDITRTADGPLSGSEVRVGELCELMFVLEGAILDRLVSVREFNHTAGNAFFELIKTAPDEKYSAFLASALLHRAEVGNPVGYRPSARDGSTLLGRLMRLGSASSPDGLTKVSKAFRDALRLQPDGNACARDSLMAVMLRPTTRDSDQGIRAARNILVTLYGSAQLVTAAAHADAYPRFPISLLRAISHDLRFALRDLEIQISSLP